MLYINGFEKSQIGISSAKIKVLPLKISFFKDKSHIERKWGKCYHNNGVII